MDRPTGSSVIDQLNRLEATGERYKETLSKLIEVADSIVKCKNINFTVLTFEDAMKVVHWLQIESLRTDKNG